MRLRTTAAGLLFAAYLSVPSGAQAQARVEFIPSMSVFAVYDDNIFARVKSSAGQMQQIRPSVEGSYQSPTVRLLGLYSFDMQRSNFSTLNTLDARRHALGEATVRTSPVTTLGLTMAHDRSQTPGEIDIEAGVLGERRLAQRLELAPGMIRRLGTRTVVTAGYRWTTENLVGGERGTLHTGRTTLSRQTSTKTALSATYVGHLFVNHIANYSSHAVLAEWERAMAPGTRLSVSAGPKFTSYGGIRPDMAATLARTTTHVRLALDYWYGETLVLGVPGPVNVNSVNGRATWPVTRRFEIGTSAGVSDVSTLDARNSTIYRGTLKGSWSPGGLYVFAASYGLDFQQGTLRTYTALTDGSAPLDDRTLRQVIRVSVTIAPRYSRSILPPDEAARAKGVSR